MRWPKVQRSPTEKKCRKCGVVKPIQQFSRHRDGADGHINKCRSCEQAWSNAYRIKRYGSMAAASRADYERQLERGTKTRNGPQKYGEDPVKRAQWKARYKNKRRGRVTALSELDAFVEDEAIALRVLRNKATGFKWSVDHIVPLHHKLVSGLHRGLNLQVAPKEWNSMKNNRSTKSFFPIKHPKTAVLG